MTVFEASGSLNPEDHRNIIIPRIELDQIINHIETKDEYLVLQAPTQSGKTTLLYQIHSRVHQHDYGVVYLDLSALRNLKPDQFYPKLCTKIQKELAEFIVEDTDPSPVSEPVTNELDFVEHLRIIAEQARQIRKLVFMIDELGNLSEELTSTLFPSIRSIFTSGRGISNDREFYKKLMFIFAGDLDLDKLIQGQNSPLRNICKTFTLNDFSQEQVHDLAQNLTNFPPETINLIADCVSLWSDGHPYFTQRLLGLIDESQECQNSDIDNIIDEIEQLVKKQILYGDDANLKHIFNYLQNCDDSYCRSVAQILRSKSEERSEKAPHAQELILMGIIKRLSNLHLVIRNKIYEEALEIFFNEFQLQDRT